MARIKKGKTAHKRHKKVLKMAKGYYGAKSKLYRSANEAVMRALRSSYRGRKERKRNFRRLWITRINAGARAYGMTYSTFMHGLKLADVKIDRKMLADLAVTDSKAFAEICKLAKSAK